jgi:hypothetical protein
VSANVYFDGSNRYISTAAASRYEQNAGSHRWFAAASGTAGNAITFTQAMTLDASGNLGVGTTTPTNFAGYRTIETFGSTGGYFRASNGTQIGELYVTGTGTFLGSGSNHPLIWIINSIERWRLNTSGHFLAGTDNTYDIGASGATRPRNVYVGSSVIAADITGNASGNSQQTNAVFRNSTNGNGATTLVAIGNDVSASAGYLQVYASGYTTSGLAIADSFRLNMARSGGITLSATDAGGVVRFVAGGTASTNERMRVKSNGQVRFIPLAADPSGAEAGDVYYNSGTNKLKVYDGSTWVDLH